MPFPPIVIRQSISQTVLARNVVETLNILDLLLTPKGGSLTFPFENDVGFIYLY